MIRTMTDDALFNLRWDAQRSALLGSMASLYREEAFVDTTIVADNKIFKAHKLLLSASSSYLKHMLESVPASQHAVIFMPHISALDLGNLLKFIYDGEIKINKRSLKSFLSVAKLLRIKGMDFELNEDLDANNPPAYAQNLSTSSSSLPSNPHKRLASEARLDEDINGSINNIPCKSSVFSSQLRNDLRSAQLKENGQSYSSSASALNNNSTASSDEETRVIRPALIRGSGRSTDSISSQTSNIVSPHREVQKTIHQSNNNNGNLKKSIDMNGSPPSSVTRDDGQPDDSNSSENDDSKNNTALNLHIGRNHDSESLDADQDSRTPRNDRDDHGGLSIVDNNDMEDDYDDDDDDDDDDGDDSFSMSIQPEVSFRESDESFNVNERRSSLSYKPISFSNSLNLSLLGNSAMSITQTPNGSINAASSPLSLQLQQQLKHFSKLAARPNIPKALQLSGQGSPQSGDVPAFKDGILMRMMREPLQGTTNKSVGGSPNHVGFFDPHNDPALHSAGLRKQKRYVQCTSCSKVLSSLSALKRHMEDVHCARIQGKCLLCGRVYSSRNSLLTHVYSAHKKNSDYRQVARIIRESNFEELSTA